MFIVSCSHNVEIGGTCYVYFSHFSLSLFLSESGWEAHDALLFLSPFADTLPLFHRLPLLLFDSPAPGTEEKGATVNSIEPGFILLRLSVTTKSALSPQIILSQLQTTLTHTQITTEVLNPNSFPNFVYNPFIFWNYFHYDA